MRASTRQVRASWAPAVGLFGPRRRFLAGYARVAIELSDVGTLLADVDRRARPHHPDPDHPDPDHLSGEGRAHLPEETDGC